MTQYINKAALVAEIEKRISDNKKDIECARLDGHFARPRNLEDYFEGYEDALVLLKQQFIDTLEAKEVDFGSNSFDATVCKIDSTYLKEMDKDAIAKVLEPYKNGDKVKVIIKTHKGE